MLDIGDRLELFVDDFLIETMTGVALRLHKPVPREVAIVHDRPWEGNTCGYHTVFQDGDGYRMYYRGSHFDEAKGRAGHQVVCMAESADGVHWTKPTFGLVAFKRSKKNNIVWDGVGSHNFAPMKDANPACTPAAAYKALGSGDGGLYAFGSPDGIRWTQLSEAPVITEGAFDSQNLAFWDATRSRYVDFHRGFRQRKRDIMTCTSTDFLTWTKPAWLKYTGAPREQLYTNQVMPYHRAPHIFMGFPKRFVPGRRTEWVPERSDGVSDGVFMTSRDGRTFRRWGEAIIRPGLQHDRWMCRNNMIAWGVVETESGVPGTPRELSLYATEGYYTGESCQVRRYTLRQDGFVSIEAPLAGGELVTRPFVFSGVELVVNFSTSAAGSIRVEIQDTAGEPVSGYRLADCPHQYGDAIEHVIRWKKRATVESLAGKPVRLRVVMKDADLYSLRFRAGDQ